MFAATLERTGLSVMLLCDNFHVIVSHYIVQNITLYVILFFFCFFVVWQQCASIGIH